MAKRRIPPTVRDEVLREAGYMCGNPRCRHILTLALHHMVRVADGGKDEATNLLALCPNCHALHHAGEIPTSAIRHWKGVLHALNHAFSKESMDLLLFLHVQDTTWMLYSGDGALRFAGLVAAGLVCVSVHGYGPPGGPGGSPEWSTYTAWLTEKGKQLVEAWLSGDEEAYRAAISTETEGGAGRTSQP